jgi:adenosylcobinamide-GDP ribazoletransferase
MVMVMHLVPAARAEGLSAGAGRPSARTVIAAILAAALIAFLSLGFVTGLLCLLAAAGMTALLAALAHRRLGGQTGDVLGAVQLIAEFGCLLTAVLVF